MSTRVQVMTEKGKVFTYPNMEIALSLLQKVVERFGSIKQITPIEKYSDNTPRASVTKVAQKPVGMGACPECGSPIAIEEGCRKCHSCGYSACG